MKKALSIILIAAMLLAVCPAAFASDTATGFTGYTYVFTKDVFPEEYSEDGTVKIAELAKIADSKGEIKLEGTDPWMVASNSYTAGVYSDTTGLCISRDIQKHADINTNKTCFAIKLEVGTAGTFIPELICKARQNGPIIDVFLVKEGTISGEINTSDFFFEDTSGAGNDQLLTYINGITGNTEDIHILKKGLDLYADKNDTKKIEDFREGLNDLEIDLKKGNYFLIILFSGKSTNVPSGKTNLSAFLNTFSLTPVEDEKLTEAFKPDGSVTAEDYSEPAVISITKDGSEIKSEKNSDGTHNITAPETNKNGAKFLYWAKGLSTQKRILIGKTNVLTNYVPDAEYANYLIPVYEDEVSGNDEYYNANGQLIPKANQEAKVSMAGYGTSNGWDQYGKTNIWVAHYDIAKPEKNIDITVTGGEGTGKYAFGDTVTCTADETKGTFKCWTKSGIYGAEEANPEIVSCDSTYTFKAWENCTVTAVYQDHHYTGNKMKIIIDTFTAGNETGVMAEFIGLDNAVEKGIMFTDSSKNTTKIAMTTKDNQFTVIADGKGTYEGYAIVENEGTYTLITDGSYGN